MVNSDTTIGKSANQPVNKYTLPDRIALIQAETLPSLLGRVRAAATIPSVYTTRKFAQGILINDSRFQESSLERLGTSLYVLMEEQ
jgi:hypothetical protein